MLRSGKWLLLGPVMQHFQQAVFQSLKVVEKNEKLQVIKTKLESSMPSASSIYVVWYVSAVIF